MLQSKALWVAGRALEGRRREEKQKRGRKKMSEKKIYHKMLRYRMNQFVIEGAVFFSNGAPPCLQKKWAGWWLVVWLWEDPSICCTERGLQCLARPSRGCPCVCPHLHADVLRSRLCVRVFLSVRRAEVRGPKQSLVHKEND